MDLSRQEFLGTAEQLRQFDVDGDQLIDSQEAAGANPAAKAAAPSSSSPAAGSK